VVPSLLLQDKTNTSIKLERALQQNLSSLTLLSPMDKRRLMRGMQLAPDYATAEGA
jgi:hypothetical protein